MVNLIHAQHSAKLRALHLAYPRFTLFKDKILAKITSVFPLLTVPADAVHCALFSDACRIRIARPTGENYIQRAYYSGHKKYHNIGLQGIILFQLSTM